MASGFRLGSAYVQVTAELADDFKEDLSAKIDAETRGDGVKVKVSPDTRGFDTKLKLATEAASRNAGISSGEGFSGSFLDALKGPGITAGITAALAVAPAAIGVAGAAAGAAFGSAYLIATNKQVKAQGTTLVDTLKGVLNVATAPMIAPLENAFKSVGTFAKSETKPLTAFFAASAGAIKPLTSGIEGLTRTVLPSLTNLIKATPLNAFAAGLKNAGEGISGMLKGLQSGIGPSAQFLKTLLTDSGRLLTVLGQLSGSVAKGLGPSLSTLLNLFTNLTGTLARLVEPLLKPLGTVLNTVLGAVNKLVGPLGNLAGKALTPLITAASKLLLSILRPLLPAFEDITGIVVQLADKVLSALMPSVTKLISTFSVLYGNQLKQLMPAFEQLSQSLAKLVIALLPVITTVLNLSARLLTLNADVMDKIIPVVADLITWLADFVTKGLVPAYTWVGRMISTGGNWLDNVKNLRSVWSEFTGFFTSAVPRAFEQVANSISHTWGSIIGTIEKPINGTLSLVDRFDGLINHIPGVKLPTNLRLAGGGVLPGYAPGIDSVPALLSPGEGVLVPEAVKAMGADNVRAINAAFSGRPAGDGTGRYAGGGIIGGIINAAKSGWDDVTSLVSNPLSFISSHAASMVTDAIPGSGMGLAIAKGAANAAIAGIKSAVGSIFSSSVNYKPGAGVEQWKPDVLKALQLDGLSSSLVNKVLYQMQTESGGNPNAINLWDSNAAAGDPSRGLMQVIATTFRQYHVPGTSENILDPLANIAAAINYAKHVYGPDLERGGMGMGSGHGYARGGNAPAGDEAWVGENGPEKVLFGEAARVVPNNQAMGGIHFHEGAIVVNGRMSASDVQKLKQDFATALSGFNV
jgi:phage-related protein